MGYGDINYINYVRSIIKKREEFVRYINHKKFFEKEKKVSPYITTEKSIFNSEVILPDNLPIAFIILISLNIGLMIKIGFLTKIKKESRKTFCEGGFIFKPLKNLDEFNKVSITAQQEEGVIVLQSIQDDGLRGKINIKTYIEYICQIRNLNITEVKNNLLKFGLKEETIELNQRVAKRIIAAIMLSENSNDFVICDFLKGEEKEFEKSFLELVQEKVNQGNSFVYLSTQMYSIEARQALLTQHNNHIKVTDVTKISLR